MKKTAGLFALLLTMAFLAAPAAAQDIEAEIQSVEQRINEARAENLHLIAPRAFERAARRFQEARDQYEANGSLREIRSALETAGERLGEAKAVQEVGAVTLRDAIAARSDALAARAPEFASDEWEDAEEEMRDAGEQVEEGDQNDARSEAAKAVDRYRAAELNAIRADVLGRARQMRTQARDADADERARKTYHDASAKLQEAEQILEGDRYERGRAREQAQAAAEQYQRALRIAQLSARIGDEPEQRVEEYVLSAEAQLARVAEGLNLDPTFVGGMQPVVEQILPAIESLYEDRSGLEETLAERQQEIGRLRGRIDSMDARLAQLEEREQSVTAELRARQQRERTLQRARSIFSSDESEVLTRDDALVMRLSGLNFPVGSAEIRPENFLLLTKLQRALRLFPEGQITVSGHTDTQGNDASNQRLSEERARAVREYLLANMTSLTSSRIEAVGYGESQPIASNDTEDGRRQNRRIDVRVTMGE